MNATVEWNGDGSFTGISSSGIPIKMQSHLSTDGNNSGASPMELIALGLAGCMAMDVISILEKKRQMVTSFYLQVDAPRSPEYPKVFTRALLTFVLTGKAIEEIAVLRSLELSATKYCPAHAMLEKAFPITLGYEIYENSGNGNRHLIHQGIWQPIMQ